MLRFGGYILALLLVFSSSASAARTDDNADVPGYQRVQLTRGQQNHLIMPATINGRPASFLLDTGVDLSFLQADRAERFGLRRLGQMASSGGQSFPLAEITELRVGTANLRGNSVVLFNASQLGGPIPAQKGARADGIIGLDFLRRYGALLNCRTRHLFLKIDPARRLDPGSALRAGFTRIPILEDRRRGLTVPCSIGGRPGRLLLDTGAFLTGIDSEAARSLGISATPSRVTARGLDGKTRAVELAQIDDLRIGSVRIAPQKFVVFEVFARKKPVRTYTGINRREYYEPRHIAPGDANFGLLGNELLDQRHAIIDLDSLSLFVK